MDMKSKKNKCTCHERDSSYTCDACKEEGYFGHMETHLEKEWYEERIKKAKEFNQKVAEFRRLPESTGCVGALGCEHCGEINYGTCMCMGFFTCERCGEENDIWKIPKNIKKNEEIMRTVSEQWYVDNSTETLITKYILKLQQLKEEAQDILEDEDGYDRMFDFIVSIAEMDEKDG